MNKLQEYRKKKNITQKELSELSGVSISSVRKYEIDVKDISNAAISTLIKFSEILDCTIYDLIDEAIVLQIKEEIKKAVSEYFTESDKKKGK